MIGVTEYSAWSKKGTNAMKVERLGSVDVKGMLADLGLNKAVFIDDAFLLAGPKTSDVTATDRDVLLNSVVEHHELGCIFMQQVLGVSGEMPSPQDIVDAICSNLAASWDNFNYEDCAYLDILDPFFSPWKEKFAAARLHVDPILELLDSLGIECRPFGSLEEAQQEELNAAIVVLDLYCKPEIKRLEDAINTSAAYAQAICQKLSDVKNKSAWFEGGCEPVLFLVSTSEEVRGIKNAFVSQAGLARPYVRCLEKSNTHQLQLELSRLATDAQTSLSWARFKTNMLEAMDRGQKRVSEAMRQLEMRDLKLLYEAQFKPRGERVEPFIGWLMGESVSAEIQTEGVKCASTLTWSKSGSEQISGIADITSGLFSLYEHATAIYGGLTQRTTDGSTYKEPLYYGDVFVQSTAGSADKTDDISTLLIVTPACSVVRCAPNEELVCLKGTASVGDRSRLIELATITEGEDDLSVTLLKNVFKDDDRFVVKWEGSIKTIKPSELSNPEKFKRVARLNRLFTSQLQQLFVSRFSRIGTPNEPGFVGVFDAVLSIHGKNETIFLADRATPEKQFFSAVCYREKDSLKLIVTVEFLKWMIAIIKETGESYSNSPKIAKRFNDVMEGLEELLTTGKQTFLIGNANDPINVIGNKTWLTLYCSRPAKFPDCAEPALFFVTLTPSLVDGVLTAQQ